LPGGIKKPGEAGGYGIRQAAWGFARKPFSDTQSGLIARILAGDHWTTITIPRGASANFNQRVWGKGHDPSVTPEKK
jgi:hypothetical protein